MVSAVQMLLDKNADVHVEDENGEFFCWKNVMIEGSIHATS